MALFSDTVSLKRILIRADPFSEAGDNDDSGKDYVHIRVSSRLGFALLGIVAIAGQYLHRRLE